MSPTMCVWTVCFLWRFLYDMGNPLPACAANPKRYSLIQGYAIRQTRRDPHRLFRLASRILPFDAMWRSNKCSTAQSSPFVLPVVSFYY
ncbi:hypothetical protein BR93DRAFT_506872 [Coniochaeta sp. PMI_546]|nr:hypothetical protein BR93DRAFT_506872 [Coniochaeta sp. PMI_546]